MTGPPSSTGSVTTEEGQPRAPLSSHTLVSSRALVSNHAGAALGGQMPASAKPAAVNMMTTVRFDAGGANRISRRSAEVAETGVVRPRGTFRPTTVALFDRSGYVSVGSARFVIFVAVSLIVFLGILVFVMRKRAEPASRVLVAVVSVVVVVGGMLFAKLANNAGWPWWIYYAVPAGATLLLPPLVFRFSRSELIQYLCLALISSPVIHALFSFLLDWHEYLPFFRVPSWRELLG